MISQQLSHAQDWEDYHTFYAKDIVTAFEPNSSHLCVYCHLLYFINLVLLIIHQPETIEMWLLIKTSP